MNRRVVIYTCLAILLTGTFLSGVWIADPLLVAFAGGGLLVCIGPILVIPALLIDLHTRSPMWRRRARLVLLGTGALCCFWVLPIAMNHIFYQRELRIAMEYPDRMAPLLEKYRLTYHAYPDDIDKLPSRPSFPRLYRNTGYSSLGEIYLFTFQKRGIVFGRDWAWDSASRSWHQVD